MSSSWVDLVARVRGLSTRLIPRARLLELARSRDLVQLGAALDELYGPLSGITAGASAEELELAVRRAAARYWRTLAHWSDERAAAFAPFLLDEDRRSVRALLRGAAARSAAGERLAGLVPTPLLPEAALEELAKQASVGAVVTILVAWGHPFGRSLLQLARAAHPDLLRLDEALNREFLGRALESVRHAPRFDGIRRALTVFVRNTADMENASTALQLATEASSGDAAELFLPGGKDLDLATFTAAARAGDAPRARTLLARVFRNGPFASLFRGTAPASLEDSVLRAEQRQALSGARATPLGADVLIAFALRVRAQVHDLRLIVWRVAAGAPPAAPNALLSVG